jgi:short-subunit dehydrogenase
MARRQLTGARILLTGASSGIGRAMTHEFARHGVRMLLVARRQELLETLADQLNASGNSEVIVHVGDVTDRSVRQALVDRVQQAWGGLDLLVQAAGVSAHARFAASSEETLRRIMEVNFFAAVELARSTLPLLSAGNRPVVVLIGSILGHRGIPRNSVYSASKFALRGWSEGIRAEWHKLGIGLLLVSPGTTETQLFDHLLESEGELPWNQPTGIAAEEVARQTIRALRRGRHEIFPNWRGRLLVLLNRASPRLVDWMMERYG